MEVFDHYALGFLIDVHCRYLIHLVLYFFLFFKKFFLNLNLAGYLIQKIHIEMTDRNLKFLFFPN